MRILGIDPGFERLGIAVLEKTAATKNKEVLLFSECFKTKKELAFPDRLHLIGQEIKKVIQEYKPDTLAIETLFMTNNQKTVMHVAETRGVILYEATLAGLPIFEATPPQIKVATTGSGSANKAQMIKMVRMLVKIDSKKSSDDELDAIAIALTAFAHRRSI